MSKNVQMVIVHIAVAVVCFIGALIFLTDASAWKKEVLWQKLPIRPIQSLK